MMLRFLRFLCFISLKIGVYYWWSAVYRKIFGRKYKNIVLPVFNDLHELKRAVSQMEWRADGILELGDAISTAKIAWGRHLSKKGSSDCDDISVFIADRISDMIPRQKRGIPSYPGVDCIINAILLTCSWRSGTMKMGGHSVCLFSYRQWDNEIRYGWMSNWYDGNPMLGFEKVSDVIHKILSEAGDVEPLGAATVSYDDLSLISWWPGKSLSQ